MGNKLILSFSVFILLCYCKGSLGQYREVVTNTSSGYINVQTGREGIQGRDGTQGREGLPGRDAASGGNRGERGSQGKQGRPGSQSGGATYIRWGSSSCSGETNTQLVYSGLAGGTFFNHNGGGGSYLCLPKVPEYISNLTYRDGVQNEAPIHGAEYENPIQGSHDYNVPCALCHVSSRATVIMLPAMATCPSTWIMEYFGYLMTAHRDHRRTRFECVDKSMESIPNSQANNNGALFYHVEASCASGLPCPNLYNDHQELNCVVCTK